MPGIGTIEYEKASGQLLRNRLADALGIDPEPEWET